MRGKRVYAMAVRKPDQSLELVKKPLSPVTDKYPALKWPILRGVVSFVESLVMGVRIITQSAEIAGLDEAEAPSALEKKLQKIFGDKLNDILVYTVVAVALVFAVALFMLLPVWLGHFFAPLLGSNTWALGIIEGLIRIIIFLAYIYLVSMSKDISA